MTTSLRAIGHAGPDRRNPRCRRRCPRGCALRTGLELRVYIPRLDQFPASEAAYFARSNDIVGDATRLVSFWDGTSTGTAQAIDHALMVGKPVDLRLHPL
jgi:hypothetical protein